MPQRRVDHAQIPILQLVWPLFVENILRTSLMSIDTLMLSRFSPKAVAAMSLVNQFVFLVMFIYMMVAIGASILIAQYLGAGRRREAGLIGVGSLVLTAALGVVLSLAVALLTRPVLALYGLDPEVERFAVQFLTIFGGCSGFMALNIAQGSILRAWGHPRDSMWINIVCLVVAVVGNAICLFGPFGFAVRGVVGVAVSNVAGQVLACVLYFAVTKRHRDVELPLNEIGRVPNAIYRRVLSVGAPTAGENISYNISQIANYSMIAQMGTDSLAATGIVLAIVRYVFMPAIAIGSGTQIKVGYLVGAGRSEEAKQRVYRYFAAGFATSLGLIVLVAATRAWLLGLFAADQRTIDIAASVIVVAVVLEPGRTFNTIIIPALKGAGDMRFTMYVGMASMWGVSVLGAWLLGIRLQWGLVGIWIAMAADEWLRGLVMLWRWHSGAWIAKSLVLSDEVPASVPVVSPVET